MRVHASEKGVCGKGKAPKETPERLCVRASESRERVGVRGGKSSKVKRKKVYVRVYASGRVWKGEGTKK